MRDYSCTRKAHVLNFHCVDSLVVRDNHNREVNEETAI